MLQQTVVATVEPYFARFLARFPDVAALAAASDDDVTSLWSGLGYYARARNLRRAAAAVVADHGGAIPASEAALRELPGIGPYTAAAVAAIAFDARAFALDGNTMRVLARLTGERRPVDLPATRAALHARGLGEVPRRRAGDFNQAMMELGALVCTPRSPRCDVCPLAGACRARAEGLTASLPRKRPRAERPIVRVVCACITDGARVLVDQTAAGAARGDVGASRGRRPRRALAPGRRARARRGDGAARRGDRLSRRGPPRVHPSGRHRRAVPRRRRGAGARGGALRFAALGVARRAGGARRFQLRAQDRPGGARPLGNVEGRKRDTNPFPP